MAKYLYFYDEGDGTNKRLLGGKGAGLCTMAQLGLPVPPGFVITTEVCKQYHKNGKKLPKKLIDEVGKAIRKLEELNGKKFGDPSNPLLVSVRSGAMLSMPGMMDTVLNLGLNDSTVKGLAEKTGNERFAYDAYRRFIQMFGKVVLGIGAKEFEDVLEEQKREVGAKLDTDLGAEDLKKIVKKFKLIVKKETGKEFPTDPMEQLKQTIGAVFESWDNKRAREYREFYKIPHDLGTAVNVVTMVFGNMGADSGTGVAFTRDPATGEKGLYGEFLSNAQGEDVVAGIRTPLKIAELEEQHPQLYGQLLDIAEKLERHYREMQDVEFTVERGKLLMLQTRAGKRTAQSAVKIAVDMVSEGLINKEEALLRVEPSQVEQLLHKRIDPKARVNVIARGLNASPGAAVGKVIFDSERAKEVENRGEKVILVRPETNPDDVGGIIASQGVLTSRGGATCVAGRTKVLTERGFLSAEKAYELIKSGQLLQILSFDHRLLRPVWRKIVAAGMRKAKTVKIAISQTGRAQENTLEITPDHKMYIIEKRKLRKKPLQECLRDGDFFCAIGEIPSLNRNTPNPHLPGSGLRMKGETRKRMYGAKYFSIKALFEDIADQVNFMGRVKQAIKRNLLFDAEKIKRDVLPLCQEDTRKCIIRLLEAPLRMYRGRQVGEEKEEAVYNFEVDSDRELDKNFIVFTSRCTPLLISNSHAAVVTRGLGKAAVVGCEDLKIDLEKRLFRVEGTTVKEGDVITINGTTGEVILGEAPLVEPKMTEDIKELLSWADEFKRLQNWANADYPRDVKKARELGAQGIGLCRTEHMFFEEERLPLVHQMILAETAEERRGPLKKLLKIQKGDFKEILREMDGLPVVIRLLDPPLHEFLPKYDELLENVITRRMGGGEREKLEAAERLLKRVESMREANPMLGLRGCRLGITHPDINEMQVRAIFEAACELKREGYDPRPEVMIPLVGHVNELKVVREQLEHVAREVMAKRGVEVHYKFGTMIEVPRAALTADDIAEHAEFFSFGTNDLTQMTYAYSRDDAEGKFMFKYLEKGILEANPFQTLDRRGVGKLMQIGVELGRSKRSDLEIGICGEHGGDPSSIEFCHELGLDYVSCSPFRIPVARMAAAHAALRAKAERERYL